jgi:hypothetical protein
LRSERRKKKWKSGKEKLLSSLAHQVIDLSGAAGGHLILFSAISWHRCSFVQGSGGVGHDRVRNVEAEGQDGGKED